MDITHVQRRLADGLAGWLGFEFACLRGYLFSEKYLALPVGQLLHACYGGVVYAEQDHPILSAQGRGGRRPQIDFLVKVDDQPRLVVETKWVGNSLCRPADLLWDCVRLQLASANLGCDALLVLGGLNKGIQSLFQSAQFVNRRKSGKEHHILPIDHTYRRRVLVDRAQSPLRTALDEHLSKYPNVNFPTAVVAGHPYIHPKATTNLSFRVYVWRITSHPSGRTFRMP